MGGAVKKIFSSPKPPPPPPPPAAPKAVAAAPAGTAARKNVRSKYSRKQPYIPYALHNLLSFKIAKKNSIFVGIVCDEYRKSKNQP